MPQTIEKKGRPWRVYQKVLLPAFPPHCEISLSRAEANDLLRASGTWMIRYSRHFDKAEATPFWYVIKDSPSTLADLSSNTRSKVRRGAKQLIVDRIEHNTLAEEGYEVYKSAFERYRSPEGPPLSASSFRERIRNTNEWECWGVWDRSTGDLKAYSRNWIRDRSATYSEIKFSPASLKQYAPYILFKTMNDHYLGERDFRYVNDGPRSLSHDTNIQDFLMEKFRFRKAYADLCLHYHPLIKWGIALSKPFKGALKRFDRGFLHDLNVLLKQDDLKGGNA